MRIQGFSYLVEKNLIEDTLKNCTVVIDGQNFFYRKYRYSKLPHVFGCESDKYAEYLRTYMDQFKKANVKCFIVFKGGHRNISKRLDKVQIENEPVPIFMKDVYKQVLDEYNVDYVISEFEAKDDVIAFAQKHNCPIISYDIEFCFSGVPYIPYVSTAGKVNLDFDCNTESIKCGVFRLQTFLTKYNLNKEKISTFITLTDKNIFDENVFVNFFKSMRMFNRNQNSLLLEWLGSSSMQNINHSIIRLLKSNEETNNFLLERENVQNFICKKRVGGLPVQYLQNKNNIVFTEFDSQWFEKGVIMKHIAIPYINLYHSNIILGSWVLEDENSRDSLHFSINIIKYAYNLLTNFNRKEFTFVDKTNSQIKVNTENVPTEKPTYVAKDSPFENGWDNIKKQKFLEHFLKISLPGFSFDVLEELAEELRLLMIALTYFSYNTHIDANNIASSVLLSYIMLGVVQKSDKNVDKKYVTSADSDTTRTSLADFFKVTKAEERDIIDNNLLHPLFEFQYCLDHFNFLNKLCGCPYKPTIYHYTFNGTFVYKILHAINGGNYETADEFVIEKLNAAPTVLSLYNDIYSVYGRMISALHQL